MSAKIANPIATNRNPAPLISDKSLLSHAIKALSFSYSPYSRFKVGAAVLIEDGAIHLGSNIENASYPLCLCAERTALAHAHMIRPSSRILAIAVVCKSDRAELPEPGFPCGACRQVISEFEMKQGWPIRIIVGTADKKNILSFDGMNQLLPYSFNKSFLL